MMTANLMKTGAESTRETSRESSICFSRALEDGHPDDMLASRIIHYHSRHISKHWIYHWFPLTQSVYWVGYGMEYPGFDSRQG